MKTAEGQMVIHNGSLIDGNGSAAVPDAVVLINEGRISYAGPVAGAPPPAAAGVRLDARGGTIMPPRQMVEGEGVRGLYGMRDGAWD